MAQNSFPTGTPVGKTVQIKTGSVARTDTTAKFLFALPKYAQIVDCELLTATASNAGTTATVSVGTTSANANELVNAQDVKTAAGYLQPSTAAAAAGYFANATSDIAIYAKYAETGTASTTGGAWTVVVHYIVTGPGYQ